MPVARVCAPAAALLIRRSGTGPFSRSALPSLASSTVLPKPKCVCAFSTSVSTRSGLTVSSSSPSSDPSSPPGSRSAATSTSTSTTESSPPAPSHSRPRFRSRAFGYTFTFLLGTASAMAGMAYLFTTRIPSDEATAKLFHHHDPFVAEVEEYIQTHPLVVALKHRPDLRLSRPVLKIPPILRPGNFTAGTLVGGEKMVVPPLVFASVKGGTGTGTVNGDVREAAESVSAVTPVSSDGAVPDGMSLFQVQYLGRALSGHPGVIHGGLLATLLDESLARCCFPALPAKVGMTARLEIDYRAPCMADQVVVLQARTVSVEGRKAWVEGRIFAVDKPDRWRSANPTLAEDGEDRSDMFDHDGWLKGKVLAQARGLFVQPKSPLVSTDPVAILKLFIASVLED